MKTCTQCKTSKELSEFNKNKTRKDGHASMCRECWKIYYKSNYYQRGNERERLYKKNKEKREQIRELIRTRKSVPCMDCNNQYPYYVMDFDHRDPKEKSFTIASMTNKSNVELVMKEIEKCDVVCANCHRIRTHGS
jgi:hypothetical protein